MKLTHQLAHTYCQGRWLALGSGGYDPYRIVPRAWSILWAEMSEQSLPAQLPEQWVARWRPAWQAIEEQEEEEQQVMGTECFLDTQDVFAFASPYNSATITAGPDGDDSGRWIPSKYPLVVGTSGHFIRCRGSE